MAISNLSLFGFFLGPTELIVVGIVALLLFGQRLPSAMRSLGTGFREFKEGVSGVTKEIEGDAP